MVLGGKKLKYIAIITSVFFSLCLLELFSYVYLKCCSKIISPSSRELIDNLNPDWLEKYYKTTYDRQLGWQPRPNASDQRKNSAGKSWQWAIDEYGARRNPNFGASQTPYVATFGDSFTFGDEVDDDETWQHFLSNILHANVANYGVGGYGTDQAFLRFRQKLDEGLSPKVTILVIYEDNFKRILNRFRPFYSKNTGLKLGFKPRADVDQFGKLRFLESPLDAPVYEREKLLKIVDASREGDFWASFYRRFEFPFSLTLLRGAQIKICTHYPSIPTCAFAIKPTWNSPKVQSIMSALILEFARICESKNIKPVILFISIYKKASYALFVKKLRKEILIKDIPVIDFSEASSFDSSKIRIRPDGGHLSPYGNKLVAKYIAQQLSETKAIRK